MATFKVTNIIKIKNVTNSDLAFRPYRQNFTYVVKSGDTLELRTNNAQKSLQYYKAVLPYADVDMIDNFDTDSFSIVVSITSGTYSGDTEIAPDGTANVTLTADGGYVLPAIITVEGATANYDSTTGVVSLSAPTGNVTITCVCEQEQPVTPLTPFAVSDEINAVQLNPTWTDEQIASYIKDNLDYRGNEQVIEVSVGGATIGLVKLERRKELFGGTTSISLFADNVWWVVWIEEPEGSYTKGWQAGDWTHGAFTWDATNKVFTSAVTAEVASVVSYANGYIYGKVSA